MYKCIFIYIYIYIYNHTTTYSGSSSGSSSGGPTSLVGGAQGQPGQDAADWAGRDTAGATAAAAALFCSMIIYILFFLHKNLI